MKDEDIHTLFQSVAEQSVHNDESVKRVFSTLIRTTLRYRDHVKGARGVIVTVKDVQIALNWFLESLNTGRLPKTDNRVCLDLLKLWLDEFKNF